MTNTNTNTNDRARVLDFFARAKETRKRDLAAEGISPSPYGDQFKALYGVKTLPIRPYHPREAVRHYNPENDGPGAA